MVTPTKWDKTDDKGSFQGAPNLNVNNNKNNKNEFEKKKEIDITIKKMQENSI